MYTIRIVHVDYTHEETIIQAIKTLDYLQTIVGTMFDIIEKKIGLINSKIEGLACRTLSTKSNIQYVAAANKSIKLLSPSNFPAPCVIPNVATCNKFSMGTFHKVKYSNSVNYFDSLHSRKIIEKLDFYHVRNKAFRKNLTLRHDIVGQIENLHKISYKEYKGKLINSSALLNVKGFHINYSNGGGKSIDLTNSRDIFGLKIGTAPQSITQKGFSVRDENDSYVYLPKISEAPDIILPLDLPDLHGVVDISICISDNTSKCLYISNLPELSDMIDQYKEKTLAEFQATDSLQFLPATSSEHFVVTHNLESPLPTVEKIKSHESIQILNKEMHISENRSKSRETSKINCVRSISGITESRAKLMEDIRNFDGSRNVKSQTSNVAQKIRNCSNIPVENEAGDFFADLHSKLAMRRRGISGSRDVNSNRNIIEKLSDIIPPANEDTSTTNSSDDEDWS